MQGAHFPKRAMAFVDGQNLYQHAKEAFGHYHPNYDLKKLHSTVCQTNDWVPNLVRFYTGIPDQDRDPMWAAYWAKRALSMKRAGIHVVTRPLRYREKKTDGPNGPEVTWVAQEKGIDVRLALDLVSCALSEQFDVAVIFSQDSDLCEAVDEVKKIGRKLNHAFEIACAFPSGPNASSSRGIDRTNWIRIDQKTYDKCLDPYDYRPKQL